MKTQIPNPESFEKFKKVNGEETARVFQVVRHRPALVTVWTKNQKNLVTTQLVGFDPLKDALYLSIPANSSTQPLINELTTEGVREVFMQATLPSGSYFLKGSYRQSKHHKHHFRIELPIYQVQRRKYPRLPLPESTQTKVRFEYPVDSGIVYEERILDIGAGGLAMIMSEKKAEPLEEGMVLPKVRFKIKSRSFEVDAEIRFKKALTDRDNRTVVKLGLAFLNLKDPDVSYISAYVFESSSKFFGRLD